MIAGRTLLGGPGPQNQNDIHPSWWFLSGHLILKVIDFLLLFVLFCSPSRRFHVLSCPTTLMVCNTSAIGRTWEESMQKAMRMTDPSAIDGFQPHGRVRYERTAHAISQEKTQDTTGGATTDTHERDIFAATVMVLAMIDPLASLRRKEATRRFSRWFSFVGG